jgi:nitrite reductase (NO-forming)
MVRQFGWAVVLCGTLALGACGGGSGTGAPAQKPSGAGAGTGGGAQNIAVKTTDMMRFEPANVQVRANVPVRLSIDNRGGALVHDFTIDNMGGGMIQYKAQPNSQANGEFTPAAGTYQFYCAEPGHKEAGMIGTLTVSS